MGKLHKLVAGTAIASTVALGFATVADADTYTVKKGDTLWDIARNNGTTVEQLMKDNHLTSDLIFPGDQLSYETVAKNVAQAKQTGSYTVVLGDTLGKIATQFGTTVDTLAANNNIQDVNFIKVGQVLNVNTKVVAQPVAAPVAEKKEEAKKPEAQKTTAQQTINFAAAAVSTAKPAPVVAKPVAKPAPVVKAAQPVATQAPAVSNKGIAILNAAYAQVGRNQDCTMLVTNALRAVGINFHDWPAGYKSLGTIVSASQAQPGDLIYYPNGGLGMAHIAVYAGAGKAVHGGWNWNQTVVGPVNPGGLSGIQFIRVR